MAHARRIAVITFVVAASVFGPLGVPPAASVVGHPSPLTGAASTRPARTAVVGRTTSYVVYNDLSNHVVYLANPGGRAAPTALARSAQATAVSGDLVEYTAGGVRLWRKLGTSQHGTAPAAWAYLAPDGGLRVQRTGGQATLEYFHLSGGVQSIPLPDALASTTTRYSVVAGPDGVAVAASTTTAAPKVAFSTLQGSSPTFGLLRTDAIPTGATLACSSLSAGAVGCLTKRSVIRLGTDGVTQPQVSTPGNPLGVAVTDGYTSWISARKPEARKCPCDMASLDATGTAVSIIAGLTNGAITAGHGRFFYSSGTKRNRAGVYVDLFAGAGDARIAPAAGRPLQSSVPALGPGRAGWVDDSRAGHAVWVAPVRPNSTRGQAHQQAVRATLSPVAVSGARTVYASANHALHLLYLGHDHVVARGDLVVLSGRRLLYRAAGSNHLTVLDLVRGTNVDEADAVGARAASLWSRYLSFMQSDGSVWRVALATDGTHSRAVRLAPAAGARGTAGRLVYSFGNWTAWSAKPRGGARVTGWRNAATLAPAHAFSPSVTQLIGASVGGPVVAYSRTGRAASNFALLSWSTGQLRAHLPGTGAIAVDGSTVGWLRNGVPTVAAIGVRIVNRPRSLGDPAATTHLATGAPWRLALATSAALTRCTVTISRGSYHRVLPCSASAARTGVVLARWRTGSAADGRYRWTISAGGTDGSLLGVAGGHRPTSGYVTLG